MADNTQKYGEILGEYKTVLLLAKMLNSKGTTLKRGLTYYQNQYSLQESEYKSKKGYKKVLKYVTDMNKVFVAAANDMFTFTMSQNPRVVDIDNTSKTNRNNLQKVKVDIELEIDGVRHGISLKQYKKNSKVQLCSGTYSSSLCSLAFKRIGQGKFENNGETFLSKASNRCLVKNNLISTYGLQMAPLYDDLILLEESVKPYQTMPIFPGKPVWDNYLKTTGQKAANIVYDLLTDIAEQKCLKKDLLERAGLDGNHHILVACNMKKPTIYSTLTNNKFANNIKLLNNPTTKLVIAKKVQSIDFIFANNGAAICDLNMPLTVNKNSAWHLPDDGKSRICSLSGKTILPYGLRPLKAKQMATSTNLYVDIKKLA